MQINLNVGDHFPLSWRCEDIKNEKGHQVRARIVGRRVWGKDIAVAIWVMQSGQGGTVLELIDARTSEVVQSFRPEDGYDSPWHSSCTERARQVAEWYEAREFNATLDLLSIEREAVPA